MHRLNFRYAQWFNERYDVSGHVFQGRFHSRLVESEWHLIELPRYIALNPVRAGLVEHPAAWRLSSYAATVGRRPKPDWLDLEWLESFGRDGRQAREEFARFVGEADWAAGAAA
jgi:hypothetical protein